MDTVAIKDIYNSLTEIRYEHTAYPALTPCLPVVVFAVHLEEAILYIKKTQDDLPPFFIVDYDSRKYYERLQHIISTYNVECFSFKKIPNKSNVFAYIKPELYGSGSFGFYQMAFALAKKNIIHFHYNKLHPHCFMGHLAMAQDILDSRTLSTVYNILADDESRNIFLRLVKALITGNCGFLATSPYMRFNHPLVNVGSGERVIEGGLCDGSTTEQFALRTGSKGHVLGFEAFPKFASHCQDYLACYPWVEVKNLGLWHEESFMQIEEWEIAPLTRLQENKTEHSVQVKTIALDTYLHENTDFDVLKINIEGTELNCLQGALKTLQRVRPKLMIGLSHQNNAIIDIPLFIHSNLKNYYLFIGHHRPNIEQTFLYALPKEKNISGNISFVGCGSTYRALKKYFSHCMPQAIFVDKEYYYFVSPQVDGIEVKPLEALKNSSPEVPIIIFTHFENEASIIQKIYQLGLKERRIYRIVQQY